MSDLTTNYLGLSVGGTLAVGGIGGSTSRYGMQTDNVLELDAVTGDGHELTCSAESNPHAFDAVRAGLGQCGIITRAPCACSGPATFGNHWKPSGTVPAIRSGPYCAMLR